MILKSLVMTTALVMGAPSVHVHEAPQVLEQSVPQQYRGVYWFKKAEPFRLCVRHRESRNHYGSRNSLHFGAYQFKYKWHDGLIWMMLSESKATHDGLAKQLNDLWHKPINHWSAYWQDRAFWTAYRNGKGAKHWHLTGSACNRLAVTR